MIANKNLKIPILIAEIGINHNGSLSLAKKLIDLAKKYNFDYVKFQKRNPDKVVPEHQKKIIRDTPWGMMSYLNYKKKIEFETKEYNEINKYCKKRKIKWFASAWDIESQKFLKQFEDFLEYTALKAEIDTSKPFPFMIEGHIRKINWHVVNWNENNVNHSREAHMASGLNGIVVEENVEIIGFYSKDHKGVFTHHNANWHMHFRAKDQNLAGHLDDLLLGEYMTLKLPKQL